MTGNGIASITKTGTSGLVDTYTITYTNGNTTTFTITNGEDGEVTETELNVLRQKLENQQKVIDQLPQVPGQGTSITLENTIEAQFTKFDVEGNSEQETNLFDGKLSQGTLDSTGVEVDSVYRIRTTNYIEVVGGTTIPIKAQSNKEIQYLVYVFNNSKEVIETMGWNDINTSQTLRLNAKYIKLLFSYKDGSAISTSNVTNVVVGDVPNPNYEQPIESAGDNENLFDTSLLPITKNGVTISKDSKGNVVLNGTPTITSGYIGFDFTLSSTYLKADTYTISVKNKIDGIGTTINQTTPGGIINLTMSDTAKVKTGKLTADLINGTMGVNVRYDVGTLDNFILNPKLEKGNKATPYSPYGMGSINQEIINKNLINFDKLAWYPIKDDGTIDTSKQGAHTDYIKIARNEDYIFRNIKFVNGVYYYISYYDSKKVHLRNETAKWVTNLTEINSSDATYIIISWLYISPNEIKEKLNPQLEPGTTATSYVPHEEQDYPIFVQQPMRSIGDVRDCFVKKSDGWYERHYIAEGIFNPYNCGLNGGGTTRLRISMWGYQNLKETSVKSKYFPSINGRWDDNNEIKNAIYGWNSDGVIGVNIDKEIASTLDEFKTWASRVGLNFYYIRKNPTDLPCTEEQIQQLENKPSTYKDFTIIQSEDETEAYLEVSGIYDLNNLINN